MFFVVETISLMGLNDFFKIKYPPNPVNMIMMGDNIKEIMSNDRMELSTLEIFLTARNIVF